MCVTQKYRTSLQNQIQYIKDKDKAHIRHTTYKHTHTHFQTNIYKIQFCVRLHYMKFFLAIAALVIGSGACCVCSCAVIKERMPDFFIQMKCNKSWRERERKTDISLIKLRIQSFKCKVTHTHGHCIWFVVLHIICVYCI